MKAEEAIESSLSRIIQVFVTRKKKQFFTRYTVDRRSFLTEYNISRAQIELREKRTKIRAPPPVVILLDPYRFYSRPTRPENSGVYSSPRGAFEMGDGDSRSRAAPGGGERPALKRVTRQIIVTYGCPCPPRPPYLTTRGCCYVSRDFIIRTPLKHSIR